MSNAAATKTLVGYCDPFAVRPGEQIELMMSAEPDAGAGPGPCRLDVVRTICGDPSSKGPGFREEVLDPRAFAGASWPESIDVGHQPLRPGSSVEIPADAWLDGLGSFTFEVLVYPTRFGGGRQVLARLGGFELGLDDDGTPGLRVGGSTGSFVQSSRPLVERRWWRVAAGFDQATGRLVLRHEPLPTRSPSDRLLLHGDAAEVVVPGLVGVGVGAGPLVFAGSFDGRLEAPFLRGHAPGDPLGEAPAAEAEDQWAGWDFSIGIGTVTVQDRGPRALHGRTRQSPTRAVTGSCWAGSVQRWADDPAQYAAIHFHRDDLTDAGWQADLRLTVPAGLPSGLYAFRITAADGEVDRVPFVVRPAAGAATAPLALLLPTATYWAYANHRMSISGAEFFAAHTSLRPEFRYIRDHPAVGYSMYEYHGDHSGVMVSSRRRPVLNLRPGADGWAFTADTNLVAYLTALGVPFDVITDDDLHREGPSLLDPYRVVMTGSHPEYWSTPMLDGLAGWLDDGGRLMYLGGNGFYWRVAWSSDEPWVMEVRRAEDGTRGWIAEPGEYYHAFGGEYGGLWRRLGRAPNQLVGVGFAAQGFDRASPYRRHEESIEGRAAWIFDGVEGEVFGGFGIGGGAAGQEIDRFDASLGSPAHAVVLATSFDHSAEMLRTKEEFLATAILENDAKVRSDVVFFEGPAGGAVFSVGSISWYGALAHNGYANDVATVTTNVLRRFLDPAPFPPPGQV